VTVWNYRPIVFSQEVSMFTVDPGLTTVLRGESTDITVMVHDLNGNPIVGGSTIEFSTQMGVLSTAKITTYTPGVTVYTVTLTNDLDPLVDTAGNTVVTVRVKSPNGEYTKQSVPIFMSVSSQ
jgi:hypothetical protein